MRTPATIGATKPLAVTERERHLCGGDPRARLTSIRTDWRPDRPEARRADGGGSTAMKRAWSIFGCWSTRLPRWPPPFGIP